MSTHDDGGDYEVGYGKPPKHGRFQKGRSGNPKGRPKGARGLNASLKRELESKVKVRDGGREIYISKAEALAKRLMEKALKGDMSAIKMLAQFDSELSAQVERDAEAAAASSEPDQTDMAILRHFAEIMADGRMNLDAEAEPVLPQSDEEEDE